MLIEGISIRHFHQLENHLPKFQQKKLLKANEFGLIPEPFIVCADGSSASYFSMRRPKNSWLDISKYSFRIKEGNVSDLRRVGMISTPVKTLDSIIVKYTHPQFINDDSNHPVFAVFTLQVINDDLDIVEYEIPIQVYRPPVLMVHGIWSNGQAAFGVMGQALLSSNAYVNEQVNILDYEGSNDVSFELNKIIVPYHIAKTIEDIVAKGWSVGKVDVVCHSMGGNLTRNYLQRDYYFNDINKLITCNTPHSGTQATNLIFSNDGENIRKILKSYDFDFNAGAVSDLKVNSAAIFKMNNPPELNRHTVPSHSITTTATAEDIPEFEPYLKKLPKYFSELLEKALIGQTLEELYGEQHDNVVPISSQSGGLIGFSTSKIDNQFHQGSTSNPDVIEKVIELLKVDPVESSNFEFYGFNPVELEFPDGLKPQTEIGGKSLLSVSILNPVKGIEVSPGSILPIEIQGSSELTNIILFVEYSKDEFYAAALNSSNGLFNFEVDGDYLGKRNIIAIGIDASSQEMVIDSSYIIVKPSTPNFLGFTVEPNQIKILKYQTASVSVKGTYIDGLTGDIVTSDVTKLHEIQLEVLEGKAMVTNKKRLFGQSIGDDDLIVLYNGISVASATIEIEDSELFDFIDVDGDGYSEMQGDCDDNNSAIFPGAPELCNNLDDNCNGTVDEDATYAPTWYADADGDGFGDADNAQQSCLQPNGFVNNPLDCDDGDINVNPIASEMCNTIDDDCDGEVDEYATDAPTWYEDADGDGFGNQYVILVQCSQPEGYVSNLDDCNDEDPSLNPNTVWYADIDGDGFGDPENSLTICEAGPFYVLNDDDCDDLVMAINPGALESCNGTDDNCDGVTDEGFDMDTDGYTVCQNDCDDNDPAINPGTTEACNGADDNCDGVTDEGFDMDGDGYTVCQNDCDDNDPAINPGATETCNGADDNCDGTTDEGFDMDTDGYTVCQNDCDDNYPAINPGATEACNGTDDNCDGVTDEGFDMDGDGYTVCQNDCDDNDPAINPGATEACNGTDDNCDGVTDEGFDMDTDGYTVCQNDCDDNAPAINPGVTEVCNGTDDNCDGSIDEGFDMDGDGYSVCQNDCDDNDPAINPGALEICNGIDDDCDVLVDTDDTNYSDDTPPIAHCKNVTVNLGENGTVSITPQQINDGSTDNCGPVTLTVDPSVLDCSNVGTTIVTLTAEDGKGNNHTCDAIVTVLLDPATVIAYTLLAQEEIQMKNTIVNGNVGLGQAGKKTKIKEFSTVNGFVKSPQIELDNNSSITGSQYFNQAPEPLSTTFKYNTQTDPSSDINIPDNYSGVYQLTGNLFRKIEVGKNSTIKFMSSGEIFIKEFKTKDSDTGNHSSVLFSDNTELVVRKKLDLGKRTEFNWVGGHKVKVYVEEEDVKVNESSKVNASIDVRFKKMSVEDAKEANHTLMNGQFIANKIDSRKWVDWDWSPFECENELPPSNNLVLPNDFLGLDATLQDIHVQLLWLTNKTGEYEVERSLDGVNFVALISKQNNSASSAVQFHDYDESPVEGVNYYRIKRINPDGSFTFSPIRQVNFNLESDFTIFPNPASDEVRLYLDRFIGKEEVDVIIVNTMGTVLFKQQLPIVEDKILPIRLDRNRFIDGLYSVSVVYRGRAQSKRLVVARF